MVGKDACPLIYGNSTIDRYGCPDADGDGWSDDGDDLPDEITQWVDGDGDGFGENPVGVTPDACPNEWGDSGVIDLVAEIWIQMDNPI